MTQERKSKAARIRKHLQEGLLSIQEIAALMKVRPEYVRAVRVRAQGPGNYYDKWAKTYYDLGDRDKAREEARKASDLAKKGKKSPEEALRVYYATYNRVRMQTGKSALKSQLVETN